MQNASIIDNSQFVIKNLLMQALYLAFGWVLNPATNEWEKGPKGRNIPRTEALVMREINIFHRKYLGTEKVHEFFDQVVSGTNKFVTNQEEALLAENTFRIFAGLKVREEGAVTPAAAIPTPAEIGALVFDDVAQSKILNGLMTLNFGDDKTIFKNEPLGSRLDNTDGINNYIRFDRMQVQEPGTSITMKLETPAAPGDFWLETALVGWELYVPKA